ncbi:MAG: hypothetical protein ACI8X5_002226 [Planctomycetota bacterium]|jgi:hypothetical protein
MMEYQMHTTGGVISPVADYDNYLFLGEIGDHILITVQTGGYGDDPRIELYDPLGVLVQSKYCSGGSAGCTVTIDTLLTENGYYTIWISDAGDNDTMSYSMSLQRVPPADCVPAFEYGANVSGTINFTTDYDFFAFEGAANSTVRVVMNTSGYGDDPHVQLVDPQGVIIDGNYCSGGSGGCTTSITTSLTLDGTYHLMVSDAGHNDTLSYNLSLNCLGGLCPGDLPPIGTRYCTGNPNSVGPGAVLEVMGSELLGCNQLNLRASGLPTGAPALFFHGTNVDNAPLGSGVLCTSGVVTRIPPVVNADSQGVVGMSLDLLTDPAAIGMVPGATTFLQCWYRDPVIGQGFNLTDAVRVDWH